MTNIADPDQSAPKEQSDMGLPCLHMESVPVVSVMTVLGYCYKEILAIICAIIQYYHKMWLLQKRYKLCCSFYMGANYTYMVQDISKVDLYCFANKSNHHNYMYTQSGHCMWLLLAYN